MLFNVVKINKVNRSIWEILEIRQRESTFVKYGLTFLLLHFVLKVIHITGQNSKLKFIMQFLKDSLFN